MRFADFRLERYGPFEQLDMPFDATPGRVNLIVAPNGYGKSVIRRSINEFLFGIDVRSPMSFRFGTERMRILATVAQDDIARPMVRRKGNGNTLALANGTEVPPEEARRLLGGADATIFQELFGLDTTLLRSGGQDLITSQGRLGQVLFAAGGGLGRVRDLLTGLERKRDELGKANARHKSRPLWSALSNWEQGAADLRKAALRPDGWAALERQASEASQNLERLLAEQAADARERDRLRTIGACRPWLDRLHSARRTLLEAADAPELDEGFERRWRDALQDRVTSASAATAATSELRTARDNRAALTFDPAWIAAEADIKALADLRGLALGAEADLPKVQRELAAEQLKSTALRRDLGWGEAVALPPAPIVKDAQGRLRQYPALAAEAASAATSLAEANRQLAATRDELAALPGQGDVAAITDLVALLRANGDPAARLDAGRRKLRAAEAALRTALAAGPDCRLTEASLSTTAAPSETKLEAAGKTLTQAEAAHDQALRDHRNRSGAIEAERTKLMALERVAMLPPPDALKQARLHRDTLWAQFFSPASRQPDPATAVALDRAMRNADEIADALIEHGQEVAEASALRGRLAAMETEWAKDAKAVVQAEAGVANARNQLQTIAWTAGGNANDMSALRAFLRARDAAATCHQARDAAAVDLADIAQHLTTLGGQLAAALSVTLPDLPAVGILMAEAERRIEAERDLAALRKTLTAQAGRLRRMQATAAAAADTSKQALAEWVGQWEAVSMALARPKGETMAMTSDALTRTEDLRATEHKAADDQRRIDDMQAAIAQLAAKIGHLSALSPDLAALPAIEAAQAFQRRLQAEHREAARCADADRRIEQAMQKLARCTMDAETAARMLDGLRAALRADTDEAAEHQLQRARAVTAARADSAEALQHLAVQGCGVGAETLTARAAETTAEADAARINEIDARHQTRLALIEAARDAAAAAAADLERASSGTDAADAARRREAAQAMLARTAEEALVLHAAHALLQAALDRQAAGTDQPLLARISDVFRTITGGAQAGVRIEETREGQKDGHTMVALEADGATRKSLDQLSEGTRDQLYLALRIAALEDYATTAPPLPFIADDVLQTFDDPRTTATLQALLQLSAKVQVIVLTHHPHVGNLAARLPGGAVHVMRLEGRGLGALHQRPPMLTDGRSTAVGI
ncbi:AAA family ATPase [Rhodopila sp.]|uniref:AAA family ATPase n=1 Tax=Rhodopila sp. TaxID=2480087 RepID=UPI003D144E95